MLSLLAERHISRSGPRLTNEGFRSCQLLIGISIPESTVKFGSSNIRKLTNAKLGKHIAFSCHIAFPSCDRQGNTDVSAKICTTKYCGWLLLTEDKTVIDFYWARGQFRNLHLVRIYLTRRIGQRKMPSSYRGGLSTRIEWPLIRHN
jgi:hypothetical protein